MPAMAGYSSVDTLQSQPLSWHLPITQAVPWSRLLQTRSVLSQEEQQLLPPADLRPWAPSKEPCHGCRGRQAAPAAAGSEGGTAAERMMAKMGWKAGQGLGQKGQGMTTPLEHRRSKQGGAATIVNAEERAAAAAAAVRRLPGLCRGLARGVEMAAGCSEQLYTP